MVLRSNRPALISGSKSSIPGGGTGRKDASCIDVAVGPPGCLAAVSGVFWETPLGFRLFDGRGLCRGWVVNCGGTLSWPSLASHEAAAGLESVAGLEFAAGLEAAAALYAADAPASALVASSNAAFALWYVAVVVSRKFFALRSPSLSSSRICAIYPSARLFATSTVSLCSCVSSQLPIAILWS